MPAALSVALRAVRQNWNPYNSGLIETVGHRRRLYEKWRPSDFLCWAPEHPYENKTPQTHHLFLGSFYRNSLQVPNSAQMPLNPWVPNLYLNACVPNCSKYVGSIFKKQGCCTQPATLQNKKVYRRVSSRPVHIFLLQTILVILRGWPVSRGLGRRRSRPWVSVGIRGYITDRHCPAGIHPHCHLCCRLRRPCCHQCHCPAGSRPDCRFRRIRRGRRIRCGRLCR